MAVAQYSLWFPPSEAAPPCPTQGHFQQHPAGEGRLRLTAETEATSSFNKLSHSFASPSDRTAGFMGPNKCHSLPSHPNDWLEEAKNRGT